MVSPAASSEGMAEMPVICLTRVLLDTKVAGQTVFGDARSTSGVFFFFKNYMQNPS
jgi:hypothetical protein